MNFNQHLLKIQVEDHLSQLRRQATLRRELAQQQASRQRTSARVLALKPSTDPRL